MKREKKKEIIVIREDDADVFQRRVNEALKQLAHEEVDPELSVATNPLTAVMTFTKIEYIAESDLDKKALKGHRVVCRHCPYFEYGVNERIGFCNLMDKQVYAERYACSHIKDGEENDD